MLFPNELDHLSKEMQNMLVQGSMTERDKAMIERMVEEKDLRADKAQITSDLVVALHQNFLYEASLKRQGYDRAAHEEEFNREFEYLLAAGR